MYQVSIYLDLASRKASKLVVVFLGRHEWSDKALRVDLPDRIRTCNLLEAILKRHSVLMLTSIARHWTLWT
uniref:SLC12 domain-containing protein n=1 Tax=Globodera pallida TaxID=36090 RepID=A0A183C9L1_GLOPA